jgi:hypothetical protein
MRVGVMYYHRTNRDQVAVSNTAVPASFYTPIQVTIPNGPGGTVANPKPQTITVYNLSSASYLSLSNQTYDNQPFLDTTYNGVEFTANKRLSNRWQMVAGLTLGRNRGGVNTAGSTGQTAATTGDLNDPNNTGYANGIIGNDSNWAFRLSGSYQFPWSLNFAATFVANQGYPLVSTFSVNRTLVPTLVRTTQTVFLSSRGDERYPDPKLLDIRVSRSFNFGGGRRIVPQIDIFNVGNSNAVTSLNTGVGNTYLVPNGIISPRIARVGVSVNF